jgi:tRNA(fMet)-specific endonuclease VapC
VSLKARYVIDTNFVIEHLRGNEQAKKVLSMLLPNQISFSVITYLEFAEGEASVKRTARTSRSLQFFEPFELLSLSVESALKTAREGVRLGATRRALNDLAIAATTLELQRTVLTKNVKDFKVVKGLRVLNWEEL